jgi:hypothetical protein
MSFLLGYFSIGILGIVLFIALDVMGGLNDGQEKWKGINPIYHFKEFLSEFREDSSCLFTTKEGLMITLSIMVFWPFIILTSIIGLYVENKNNKKENEEN